MSVHTSCHRLWRVLLVRVRGSKSNLRVLWTITLALVVREIYLEHSGNVARRGPTGGAVEAMKDGSVPMDNQHNGTPMSNPNL